MSEWRGRVALQQPAWPNPDVLAGAVAELSAAPGLVAPDECDQLRDQLAAAARGEAFVLQGGDCAETFAAVNATSVRDKLRTILQMAVVLTYGASVPIVKIGRIAGQFAKPRSADIDSVSGLPSYRGDAVNDLAPTETGRIPDPRRLVRAYQSSATTLNLIRAYNRGGLTDLKQVHGWNKDFVRDSPAGKRYESLAEDIDRALAFMRACGVDIEAEQSIHGVEFFASHEALLLDYEEPLTRYDEDRHRRYDLSGHLLWLGERTRDLDGAHVEFLAGIANPIAVKLGPGATADDVIALAKRLDPDQIPGRLSFIVRAGADRVRDVLPSIVDGVRAAGLVPAWICDPMHGNTITSPNGYKTRRFDDVIDEVRGFFEVHRNLGTTPGGLHVELTGEDVTECLGGAHELDHDDLDARYETACDPRLNTGQSLELAFLAAEMLRE